MTTFAAWIALPAALGALSLGCGLALEGLAGVRLRAPLLMVTGFSLVSIVGQLATLRATTASLATAATVALAIVGFGTGLRRRAADWWCLAAATGTFVAYAAPAAASGQPTFAGYIKLDDTATYLAMVDRAMTHGRSLAGLPPSTYEATLSTSLAYGYPLGSLVPLGIAHELLRMDVAWLWQPYLSFLGALVALGLYALARPVVGSGPLAALAAAAAAQPALLFAYSLWGGIKELAAAALIPAAAAAVPIAARPPSARAVLPLAVLCAALLGIMSLGGLIWLLPLLVGAFLLLAQRRGLTDTMRRSAVFLVAFGVCAMPTIVAAIEWLPHSRGFTSASEFGNLRGPLRWLQVFGIWPVGDFRFTPKDLMLTHVLIGAVAAAALVGFAWAVWARWWEIVSYVLAVTVGTLVIVTQGSPWVGAKAFATASPVAVFLALTGAAAFVVRIRTADAAIIAGVVSAVVIGGIAWSNVLAYRAVWLAPEDRLAELELIGKRFAEQGPALMTEFEPYGARHFLRRLDAEGASELRRRFVYLRSGVPLAPQAYTDIDRIRLPDVLVYRTLLLRRSPVGSRPPSTYRLVWSGRWYQVWQRPDPAPATIVVHHPLGTELQPGAVPSCSTILRSASEPGVRRLVAPLRAPVVPISLAASPHLPTWSAYGDGVYARGRGTIRTALRIPEAGRYSFWLGGSFLGHVELRVDGRPLGSARHQLEWSGQYIEFGTASLEAGLHALGITYSSGGIRPGTVGQAPLPLGPLVAAPEVAPRLMRVLPSQARSLCGRRLDWIEGLRD
jgi:hypothetical protein